MANVYIGVVKVGVEADGAIAYCDEEPKKLEEARAKLAVKDIVGIFIALRGHLPPTPPHPKLNSNFHRIDHIL